jgi:CRISPR-associated protein Csx16
MNDGKLAELDSWAALPYHDGMDSDLNQKRHGVTWFVSRHRGAIEWARRQGFAVDRWSQHLAPAEVGAADTVIGTLPVNLAAQVCERGARYLHLSLELPAAWRGRELTATELESLDAHLAPFQVDQLVRGMPDALG